MESAGMFNGEVSLKATLTSSDGDENGQIALRNVVFGMSPGVMITPELAGEDGEGIVIHVEAVDIDHESLCDLFELLGRQLRNATEVQS